jgi:DNA-binding transcriptional LysR family regulator
MVDMDTRLLRAFVTVAEELSFTRAAERLFIAQQALSSQIQQLEARLGVKLFERTTRKVRMSEAGELLLPHAVAALQALARRPARAGRRGVAHGARDGPRRWTVASPSSRPRSVPGARRCASAWPAPPSCRSPARRCASSPSAIPTWS